MNKEILKLKKRVCKFEPNAHLKTDYEGLYYISNGTRCITNEFMIPRCNDELRTWQLALDILKITQNINRTHPDRMSNESDEKKMNRIIGRRFRAEKTRKKNRKSQMVDDFDDGEYMGF